MDGGYVTTRNFGIIGTVRVKVLKDGWPQQPRAMYPPIGCESLEYYEKVMLL